MNTFMPFEDFTDSLMTLDEVRLGNQIYNEGINLLEGKWKHHPISKMWKGYEYQLCNYLITGLNVLVDVYDRPYPYWFNYFERLQVTFWNRTPPPWIGYEPLHISHQSNLLRKDWNYYSKQGFKIEDPTLLYIWYDPILKKYFHKTAAMKHRIYLEA